MEQEQTKIYLTNGQFGFVLVWDSAELSNVPERQEDNFKERALFLTSLCKELQDSYDGAKRQATPHSGHSTASQSLSSSVPRPVQTVNRNGQPVTPDPIRVNGKKPVMHVGDTCPLCHEGVMALRKGKFGTFLSCSNYRLSGCRQTADVAPDVEVDINEVPF